MVGVVGFQHMDTQRRHRLQEGDWRRPGRGVGAGERKRGENGKNLARRTFVKSSGTSTSNCNEKWSIVDSI